MVRLELEFKPDCARATQMWDAFWQNGDLPRPLVSIIIPKSDRQAVRQPTTACMLDSVDEIAEQVIGWAASHDFIGEAIPSFRLKVGCVMSAMLGAKQVVNPDSPNTVWSVPWVDNWDDCEIVFDPENDHFQMTLELMRTFRKQCDDRVMIFRPTLVSGLDVLASLRGTEKLLMDMIMMPEKLTLALNDVDAVYQQVLQSLIHEQGVETYGDITRHQMYYPGPIGVPQSDISCMFSQMMFDRFVTPWLKKEVRLLGMATYHLDGPGALHHLETICQVDGIESIQWQPGAGNAMAQDWTHLYREIDTLGMKQVLGGGGVVIEDHDYIKKLCKELDWRKLFFVTTARSKSEAEKFLYELELICRDHSRTCV